MLITPSTSGLLSCRVLVAEDSLLIVSIAVIFAVRLLLEKVFIRIDLPSFVPLYMVTKSPSLKPASTRSSVAVIDEDVVVRLVVKLVFKAAEDTFSVIEEAFA